MSKSRITFNQAALDRMAGDIAAKAEVIVNEVGSAMAGQSEDAILAELERRLYGAGIEPNREGLRMAAQKFSAGE